jgi:Flp pilus assembly protein TadG
MDPVEMGKEHLSHVRRCENGVMAVEFAMVAPVMILLMLASVELPRAIMTGQEVSRAARTMADLVSRENLVSLDDVYAAGAAVADLPLADLGIVVTAAGVYSESGALVAKVCSIKTSNATGLAVKSVIGPAPPASAEAGARYVMAEVGYTYKPAFNIIPALMQYRFSNKVQWPVRKGTTYKGKPEVVLPNGKPCA